MTLHVEFVFPDGTRVTNMERGVYAVAPEGFFGTEQPRVEVLTELVKDAPVTAYHRAAGGVLMELTAIGRPGEWCRTHVATATTPCPRCYAMPGVPCPSTGIGVNPHHVRTKAARALRQGDHGQPIEVGQVWVDRHIPGRSLRVRAVYGVEVQVDHIEHPRADTIVKFELRERYRLDRGAPPPERVPKVALGPRRRPAVAP